MVNLGMPSTPPPTLAPRRKSKQLNVGSVLVGGDAPVSVQSMCTTLTSDVNATLQQIAELTASGCQIVRVAVPSQDDADALSQIAKKSQIPVIADIHLLYLFISGALASVAMILPGISGAFILVLLGSYATVLTGVHERNISIVGVVGLGAVTGLLSFSSLLKWMLTRFQHQTLAVLVGFMLGALPKIWPWKYPSDRAMDIVTPWNFPLESQWPMALCLMLLGIFLILGLERLAQKPDAA